MSRWPQEAYVIDGTYCPDAESALRQAEAAAAASCKGMYRSGYGPEIIHAANQRPLTEVTVSVSGTSSGRGINPDFTPVGIVRAMRVRWADTVTIPAPSSVRTFSDILASCPE